MDINIAGPGDAQTVLALVEGLLRELGAEGEEFPSADRARLVTAVAARLKSTAADFIALLARDETGKPVGILTLSVAFAIYAGGEYGVVDEMYVSPDRRGQGVGTALVEQAAAIARGRGWRRLDVTTPVDDHLSGAARFYRRCGFEPTGEKLRLLLARHTGDEGSSTPASSAA